MDLALVFALFCIFCAAWFVRWATDPLKHIPTMGPSLPLFSYIGTFRFFFHARSILQEGYEKYTIFRVAMPVINRWVVIVSGARMNDELCKFSDEQVSFSEAVEDTIYPGWMVQPDIRGVPMHVHAIKETLTRNLDLIIPNMFDEIRHGFEDLIPALENGWFSVAAFPTMMEIVTRVNNRVLVGQPLCRNKEFLDICMNVTKDAGKGAVILGCLPSVLGPIVERLMPWSRRAKRRILPLLMPLVDKRCKQIDQHGDAWPNKPKDLLMWCMEKARQRKLDHPEDLFSDIVVTLQFAALHNTTVAVTHVLYDLAANAEYVKSLREEAEVILQEEGGWTKTALGRMVKLDSFMRESQRMNGSGGVTILRKALKDLTFSDGTYIPQGTMLAAITTSTHRDSENYSNADVFDPYRFSRMEEKESGVGGNVYVSTSPSNLGFGHGKHACPGRFYVASQLKMMVANMVLKYDIKLADHDGGRPGNRWFAAAIQPSSTAKVLFRKRGL